MYAIVIAKGVTDFANNCEQLKYGLHLDAVISRWAREHANEVGALEVTKIKRYIQEKSHFLMIFLFRRRWAMGDGARRQWAMGEKAREL